MNKILSLIAVFFLCSFSSYAQEPENTEDQAFLYLYCPGGFMEGCRLQIGDYMYDIPGKTGTFFCRFIIDAETYYLVKLIDRFGKNAGSFEFNLKPGEEICMSQTLGLSIVSQKKLEQILIKNSSILRVVDVNEAKQHLQERIRMHLEE